MSQLLQFLGAAGTVTGSRFLLNSTLVDCGLFQGLKDLRLKNWAAFPQNPRKIERVLLTHAHLDHSGYLPLLVKQGFTGPILCTEPTRDLLKIILLDSAKIQEEDAEFANRRGFSKHAPALPLYTTEDAVQALTQVEAVSTDEWIEAGDGLGVRMSPNGHILGSVSIEVKFEGQIVLFSGDLGRASPLLLHPGMPIRHADHVVIESTYGDRLHAETSASDDLRDAVLEAYENGGRVLIPAFAIGRTQEVIFLLSELQRTSQIPRIPVFLDSPMAIRVTEVFNRHPSWHRLTQAQVDAMDSLVTLVRSSSESIEVMKRNEPLIVIAGSGMASGGRILHHLEAGLPDPRNGVLLTGYQALGTRGRSLRDGCLQLKFHGRYVPVRARVHMIEGLSGHADQSELIAWLRNLETQPRSIHIVHGEPQSADALRVKIRDELG